MAEQTFGTRLKQLREGRGLTQIELAERSGLHRFAIAKFEQGVRQPTWESVERLCDALGVECTEFRGTSKAAESEEPHPKRPPGRPKKRPAGEPGGEGKPKGRDKRRGEG